LKYTLCITHVCNLACDYCYIGKRKINMSLAVANKIINFAFLNTPIEETINIGFFGGEPLLEFDLIVAITDAIERHPMFNDHHVELTVVTNGTVFSKKIADFLRQHNIGVTISCDGPPEVQDIFRHFANGARSSSQVENTIKQATELLPFPLVNAVYHPRTFRHLPQVVEYFSSLGLRHIYLNPDFSATWSNTDCMALRDIYGEIGELYIDYYIRDDPHFISLIDSKITVILRGGYRPLERCRMGKGEFAFTPEGYIYPCERLIGAGIGDNHCIGHIDQGPVTQQLSQYKKSSGDINTECMSCGIKNYCMNWCGCSNYFASGYYNRVNSFLCTSEKSAIQTAYHVFQQLEAKLGPTFYEHLGGQSVIHAVSDKPR